jgi:hypothetical protein
VKDEIGLTQVTFTRKVVKCSGGIAFCCKCNGNGYIRVIGQVTDYYGLREIVAYDVCPVSIGNKLTFHLLEVTYYLINLEEPDKITPSNPD